MHSLSSSEYSSSTLHFLPQNTQKNIKISSSSFKLLNMLHDPIGIASCFSGEDQYASVIKSGQTLFISVYKTHIAGSCRCITITWLKHHLFHGLSVSVDGDDSPEAEPACKVELKPWCFWRKQGSKSFSINGIILDVFWDLKVAKFNGETEPTSEYYVAVVCDQEVVLLLGDLKKDAYRKTGCRPALIEPILVSRKEHVFGKKRFSTRLKFHEKGQLHELSIECKNKGDGYVVAPAMEIRIDGRLMINVKHLKWKFRGNECIHFSKVRIEVYWDIHDWLFSPGLRHALFIFKLAVPLTSPAISGRSSPSSSQSSGSVDGFDPSGLDEFCLFLYAWKVE